jgi:antiviral helicase SKI2
MSKFDGVRSRILQPAEYTQMAGRAGRRGLDENGTVIMICKGEIPPEDQLKLMILGKPMRLESQFRLTYAMILYLLRVEMVTVENMMSHSFREFGNQMKIPESKTELKKMEDKISSLSKLSDHLKPLCDFYNIAYDYLQLFREIQPLCLTQPKIANELKPGRILIVSHPYHYNKLALLLAVSTQIRKESTYKVLVLDNEIGSVSKDGLERGDMWHQMLALSASYRIFLPEGVNGHTVLTVKGEEIMEITKRTLKIDAAKVLQNWDTRQIPRFK